MPHALIIGTEGALGRALAAQYRALGYDVSAIAIAPDATEPPALQLQRPIDLMILADDVEETVTGAAGADRDRLRAGLRRLTYLPFTLAVTAKPALAAASGRLVLASRTSAAMTAPDPTGRYLQRPFRAAAHALWRCLAVEWQALGIACCVVAIDDPTADLPALIAAAPNGALPLDAAPR